MKEERDTIYEGVLDIIRNNIPEGGIITPRIIIDEFRKQHPEENITDKNIRDSLNVVCKNLGMYGKVGKSEFTSFYVKKLHIDNSKGRVKKPFIERLDTDYSKVYAFINNNFSAGETINAMTVWKKYHANMNDELSEKFDYYYERVMETLLRDGKIKPSSKSTDNLLNTQFIVQGERQQPKEKDLNNDYIEKN